MSTWNNAPAAPTAGNYAKFVDAGDNVIGTVTHVDPTGATTVKGAECPLVQVDTGDGEPVSISCSQAQLWQQMLEARPEVGDKIAVQMTQVENRPNGHTLKHFTVEVKSST